MADQQVVTDQGSNVKRFRATIQTKDGRTKNKLVVMSNFQGDEEAAKRTYEQQRIGSKVLSIKEEKQLTKEQVDKINADIVAGRKPAKPL